MPELALTEYRLKLTRELRRGESPQLRGFFGKEFSEHILLHHHRQDGSLVYDYPRIQFKVLDRQAVLIGLEEGSELLTRLWLEVDQAKLGTEYLEVQEATVQKRRAAFGEVEDLITYRFLSPWLALNQENERQYRMQRDDASRTHLLERIVIGNCLSFAKAFSHTVTLKLQADCSRLSPTVALMKGVSMQGFLGTFRINFLLPDRMGIGKSVSRGFGTVLRLDKTRHVSGVKP